jgi:hypothetical protein
MSFSFRQSGFQFSAKMLSCMPDKYLAHMVDISRFFDMPDYLDDAQDITQKFVHMMHLNTKPTVLDQQQFDLFLQENGIPRNQIMARSVHDSFEPPRTAQQIVDMFKYDEFNYIGGKFGGAVIGSGSYFAMNGGHPTKYGDKPGCDSATIIAVYNPATARVIDYYELRRKMKSFSISHPEFVSRIGKFNTDKETNNASIYALVMGYNAISRHDNTRWNDTNLIIDRSALVVLK